VTTGFEFYTFTMSSSCTSKKKEEEREGEALNQVLTVVLLIIETLTR